MKQLIKVGDTFENHITRERYTFLATASSTAGAYVEFDNFVPAGLTGPPMHIHPKQTETFTVLSGQLHVVVDGEKQVLKVGDVAEIPAGVAHAFENQSGEDVLFRVKIAPALDSEQFFAGITIIANQNNRAMLSLRQLAKLIVDQESQFQLVGPPVWMQSLLFRFLARF